MHANLAMAIGSGLTLVGWLSVRAESGALSRLRASIALDALIPAVGFLTVAVLTQRPIFSGGMTLALCAGFAFADYCKRKAFGEPILLADFYSTADILKHPEICLIFPRPMLLAAAVVLVVAAVAGLFALEPATLVTPVWAGPVLLAVLATVFQLFAKPLRKLVLAPLLKLKLTARPRGDARQVGAFAMLLAHTLLARAQRDDLQAAAAPTAATARASRLSTGSPILLVQSESFFDPRRLHPGVSRRLLAAYDRCRAEAVQWGAFGVPAWGANTERTEFSVLTGLSPAAIGFDRFNPYRRFARAPVTSLAWRLRAEGYRTICIHPFDRTFYGRDKVFAKLGFDVFLGEEAFAGAERRAAYIRDTDVARMMTGLLREHGPKTFVFAITMENHAPWGGAARFDHDLAPGLPPLKDEIAFRNYLAGVASADAMIEILSEELHARGDGGLLAFYGDHLPNLTGVFSSLNFRSRRSDYFLWRAGGGEGRRMDLAAHNFAEDIWRAHVEPLWPARPIRDAGIARPVAHELDEPRSAAG
ncbi:MAG: LTA synthase family protein [Caulobacteraceae bacterium]|nr:LTA synthase family protein [Caulobacteraceae bacterium]